MRAILTDSAGNAWQTELQFTVEHLAWGLGGPSQATLAVNGPQVEHWSLRRALGLFVTIYDDTGEAVWWGLASQAQILHGEMAVRYSLDDMFNRVAVAYTEAGERFTTEWGDDERSQAHFGAKELLYSRSEVTADQAEALRDDILAQVAKPVPSLRFGRARASLLMCIGLWETLDWTYYADSDGRIVFDTATASKQQPLGWGMTSDKIGFLGSTLHDGSGRLGALQADMLMVIAGSPANSGTWAIKSQPSGDGLYEYTADTITFESDDDIYDSANGLSTFRNNAMIEVEGSTLNDGWHMLDSVGRNSLTTYIDFHGPAMQNEYPETEITIRQGMDVGLKSPVAEEKPAASVTLTLYGQKIRQSFDTPGTGGVVYQLGEIWLRVGKEGTPVDNLQVSLYANSGGAPGTLLESITVAGDDLGEVNWVQLEADIETTMSGGTTYHLVVERTGANDPENYYVVELDEDAGAGGTFKVWDGSAWQDRWAPASLLFQIWGHNETNWLMEQVADAGGQFLAGVSVRESTGLFARIYRPGDNTCLDEMETLIESGTLAGQTLWAEVTRDRHLVIDRRTTETAALLHPDGRLTDLLGNQLPAGRVPVGRWVEVVGAPTDAETTAPLSPFFLVGAEWENGRLTLQPAGAPSPWEIGKSYAG